jgi:hypothetical protein
VQTRSLWTNYSGKRHRQSHAATPTTAPSAATPTASCLVPAPSQTLFYVAPAIVAMRLEEQQLHELFRGESKWTPDNFVTRLKAVNVPSHLREEIVHKMRQVPCRCAGRAAVRCRRHAHPWAGALPRC